MINRINKYRLTWTSPILLMPDNPKKAQIQYLLDSYYQLIRVNNRETKIFATLGIQSIEEVGEIMMQEKIVRLVRPRTHAGKQEQCEFFTHQSLTLRIW